MKRILPFFLCLLAWVLVAFVAHAGVGQGSVQEYTTLTAQYRSEDKNCYLEISYKDGAADRPVIVWFHGGGLTKGIAKTPAELLTEDYVVASVSYRLYPDVSVKEIIDDAALAVAWVVKNAKQYGGSLDKIYLSGHSAGGYLVSMISLDKSYLARYGVDANMIAGVIPLSGQMITHFTERKARGMERTKIVVDEMAPLYHLRADASPFLLITGDRDLELLRRYEENAYFYEMMKLSGHKDIILHELGGFNHGGMSRPGKLLLMDYIKKHNQ